MTESNACAYQQTTDQVTDIHNYPVFQHATHSNLFFQKRDCQQTVSGKQFTSRDQNHGQTTREYTGTDKFSKWRFCNGYCNGSRTHTAKSNKGSCQNRKNDHFRNRCIDLTFSGCNVIFGHFGRCKKVHDYTSHLYSLYFCIYINTIYRIFVC